MRIKIPIPSGDAIIEVVSTHNQVLGAISRFMLPYTSGNSGFEPRLMFFVHVKVSPSLKQEPLVGKPGFRFYTKNYEVGWIGTRYIVQGVGFRCVEDDKCFELEALSEEVAYVEGRCLVRACLEKTLFDSGYLLFHSAVAVSPNNEGVIIIGEKDCGKTTILMTLLDNGFSYLENDRAFVSILNGKLVAMSRPAFTRIGQQTCNQVSFLRQYSERSERDAQGKIFFDQFLATTGIQFRSAGEITKVVVANIFDKPLPAIENLFLEAVIKDIPGLAAFHNYFPDSIYSPEFDKIADKLGRLPIFVQGNTNFPGLFNFLEKSKA